MPEAWSVVRSDHPHRPGWHSSGPWLVGRHQPGGLARTYLRFDTAMFAGKRIISAELNLLQTHAASCTPHGSTVRLSGGFGPHTSWLDAPSTTPSGLEERTSNASYTCGTAEDPTPVSIGPTGRVTLAALLTSDDGASADLTGVFDGEDLTAGTPMPVVSSGPPAASGDVAEAVWSVEDDHVYGWHVTNQVSWSYNGETDTWDSTPSGDCWFRVVS